MDRGTLSLDNLQTVVLDEADEIISMGFKEDLEKILKAVPKDSCDTWLFSAFANARMSGRYSLFVNLSYLKNNAPLPFVGLGSFTEFRGNAGVRVNFDFKKK